VNADRAHASPPPAAAAQGEERVWEEEIEVLIPHYGISDVPPPAETLLYAWQYTLVDVSPFVLPMIVAGAVGYSAASDNPRRLRRGIPRWTSRRSPSGAP